MSRVCPMVCVSARLSPLLCVFHLLRFVCFTFEDLCVELPSTDTRRMAWLSRDKISSAGLTSWPTKKCAMDDTTFSEMLTQFLGRESFMVRHLAGKCIPCSLNQHTTCCKFGFELSSATLPVATFNDPHDEASQALYMGLMSTVTTVRVEPAHLFSGIVPPDLMVPTEYKKQPAIWEGDLNQRREATS